jgi:hypothetical protein
VRTLRPLLFAAVAVAVTVPPAAAVRAPASDAARATAVPPPAPLPAVPAAAEPPPRPEPSRPEPPRPEPPRAEEAAPAAPGRADGEAAPAGPGRADGEAAPAAPGEAAVEAPAAGEGAGPSAAPGEAAPVTPALPADARPPEATPAATTQWVFARDRAGARAAAWIAPAGPEGRISLRCVTAPRARTVSAEGVVAAPATPGFVDLVVDAGVFFADGRPGALRSAPFRISELRIAIDGAIRRSFNARYVRDRDHYVTSIALDDPFLEGLMAGYTLWVDEPLAEGRVRTTLAGSRDAVTSLIDACP